MNKKVKTANIILVLYYGIVNHTKKKWKPSQCLQQKVNGENLILVSIQYVGGIRFIKMK